MNRIKYAEQLYALISMCLGCAFIVFGLLSFIGILQPTSASIVQSQRNIGIVFSVLGVAFLISKRGVKSTAFRRYGFSHLS